MIPFLGKICGNVVKVIGGFVDKYYDEKNEINLEKITGFVPNFICF